MPETPQTADSEALEVVEDDQLQLDSQDTLSSKARRRSIRTKITQRTAFSMSEATFCAPSWLISTGITIEPLFPNSLQSSWPSPEAPPVTMATLFL